MSPASKAAFQAAAEAGVFDFLTDEEKQKLTLLRVYAGPEPVPDQELLDVLEWAQRVRMSAAFLEAVLAGDALPVGLKNKADPTSMQLRLTPKGEAHGAVLNEQLTAEYARKKR